jgi:hypothetical protein
MRHSGWALFPIGFYAFSLRLASSDVTVAEGVVLRALYERTPSCRLRSQTGSISRAVGVDERAGKSLGHVA